MVFLDSTYYESDGLSEVTIGHRGNRYTGYAHLHPDDAHKASQFTGCRYAEMRAQIKALKAEYAEKKTACEECRKFVTAVTQYANFNPEDPSAKAMFRQLNRRVKEVNKLAEEIGQMEFNLNVSIRQQDRLAKRMENKTKSS